MVHQRLSQIGDAGLLTSGRAELAVGERIGKAVVWYKRALKLLIHVMAFRTLQGACGSLASKYAVAASLVAVL